VAEWVGFRWLCTFSICLNGLLLLAWLNRKNKKWKTYASFALAAFLLVNGMGWWRLRSLPPPDALARVLLVQPNIGNREKEKLEKDQTFREVALARYYRLTDEALRQPVTSLDFVLWPENAFPGIIGERELKFGLGPSLRKYLSSRKIPLVTGSYGIDEEFKITNALFALTKEGVWSSPPYHKRILLPFGEFVPGAEIFPFLKNWFPDVREFGRGGSLRILEIGGIRLGPQICYEGLFDSVSRDLANAGTQIIVNVTNDSWYGSWQEPWQHFYITMAKAIETRRPLLRGTNTGVSGVALADGTITRISPVATEWFGLEEIPYRRNPEPTFFMGWGFWFDWIFIGLGLLLVLIRKNLFPVANRL
jgi:apolipoprotein N-acyltransferase